MLPELVPELTEVELVNLAQLGLVVDRTNERETVTVPEVFMDGDPHLETLKKHENPHLVLLSDLLRVPFQDPESGLEVELLGFEAAVGVDVDLKREVADDPNEGGKVVRQVVIVSGQVFGHPGGEGKQVDAAFVNGVHDVEQNGGREQARQAEEAGVLVLIAVE